MAFSVAGKRDWSLTQDNTSDFFPSKKQRVNTTIKRNVNQTTMEDQYEDLLEWKARFASLSSRISDMQDLNDLNAAGLDPLATFDEVTNEFPFLVCSSDEDEEIDVKGNFEDMMKSSTTTSSTQTSRMGVSSNKLNSIKSRSSAQSPDSVDVDVASSPLSSMSNESSPIPEEEFVVDMEGIAGDGGMGRMEDRVMKKNYELLSNDVLIYTITNLLSNEKLKRVLDIVSESNAPLDTNDSGEVEFDLSLLDTETLLKLNEYVSEAVANGSVGEESPQSCFNTSLSGHDESSVSSPPILETSSYSLDDTHSISNRHRTPVTSSAKPKSKSTLKPSLVEYGMDESSPDISPIKPKSSTHQHNTTHKRTTQQTHITQAKLLNDTKRVTAQTSSTTTTVQQRKRKRTTPSKPQIPTQSKIIKSLSSSTISSKKTKPKKSNVKAKPKSTSTSKQTKSLTSVTKRSRSTNSKLTNSSSSITNIVTNVIYLEPCRPRKEGGPEVRELFKLNQILTVNNSIEDDEEEIDIC